MSIIKRISLLLFFVCLTTVFYPTQTVWAHAVPVESEPRPNQVLDASPTEVLIEFNEPVVPNLSQIRLLSQAGERIDTSLVTPVDSENRILKIDLPELKEGAYLVSWQVLSSVDGHTTNGTFSFGVGDTIISAAAAETTISAQISPFSTNARWLFLLGLSLLTGLFVFRIFIWNPVLAEVDLEAEEEAVDLQTARSGVRLAHIGILLLFISLGLILYDQHRAYSLFEANNLATWLGTQFGLVWLIRLLLVAVSHLNLSAFININNGRHQLKGWEWWAGFILTLGLTLSNAMVSHSAALSDMTLQSILIDWGHVIAGTFWVGGLIYFAVAVWQSRHLQAEVRSWLTLSLILNFSALAAISVGILTATGTYLAWQHIGSWTLLVGTAYGLVLVYKIGLALLVFLLAAVNLFFIKPRLNRAYDGEATEQGAVLSGCFRKVVIVESILAIGILILAGILTDFQRGADAPLLTDAPGKTTLTTEVDGLAYQLEIEPALVGQNSFEIEILDENGDPIAETAEVNVRYTFLGQSVGAESTPAMRLENGRYLAEGSYISLIGDWQIEISVRQPGSYDSFAPFRLEAGIGGTIRPLDEGVRPLESFAKWMTLLSTGGTGAGMILFALIWGFIATRASRSEWQLLPLLTISLLAFWFGTSHLINFFDVEYTPAKFATNPILPNPASIASGQSLYNENCVPCHGVEGRGDGPAALSLNPPPVDFTDGHTATHTDGDLFFWILQGVEGSAMPAFEEKVTREEAWHLVNYIRRLSSQSTTGSATQAQN